MKTFKIYYILALLATWMFACKPQEDASPGIGIAPNSSDVTFTITPDAANPNIIHLKNTSKGFILKWKLGNGAVAEGSDITVAYPLKGEYLVELSINTKSGAASATKVISIANTNFALLQTPDNINLTGGIDDLDGKTWVIDSTNFGHMGGPAGGTYPEWWQAPALDKVNQGLYNDRYTFKLQDFVFKWNTNGDVFANAAHAGDIGGTNGGGDQRVAPYNSPNNLTWGLSSDGSGNKFLTVSNGSFIGFYTGVSTFQILSLSKNEMYIKFLDSKNAALAWYHRLIPEGYTPPTANFTFSVEGKTATFTNTSVASATYSWDFGDGSSSTAQNPAPHTYAANGTYTVKLIATNSEGSTSTSTKSVLVADVSFTLANLTGGSSKTWKLKTGANTWGVGPSAGSFEWYPGGTDISGDRPCVWNDTYTFKSNGDFVYDAKGDVFVEGFMGVAGSGCSSTTVLDGTNANIWNSATNSFTFAPAAGADKAKISLNGLGAFIGLAKAYDGGEFSAPPTTDNYNITYHILNYTNEGGVETITIGINIGGGWWSFVLVAQ